LLTLPPQAEGLDASIDLTLSLTDIYARVSFENHETQADEAG
jgi:hypothetical protein